MNQLTCYSSSLAEAPVVKVPASKSISNRLLMLSALHGQNLSIKNLSSSEDTMLLSGILCEYFSKGSHDKPFIFNCGNAGTVLRFLTAFFSFRSGGIYYLACNTPMKSRPIYPLVDSLRRIGCHIEYLEKPGYPPLKIMGQSPSRPLHMVADGSVSSQFITALLLVGSRFGLHLEVKGALVSASYIEMTLNLFSRLNISYQKTHFGISLEGQFLPAVEAVCEYDWSSAAPWYVFMALRSSGSKLHISGLEEKSIQGDAVLARFFRSFGVTTSYGRGGITLEKQLGPTCQGLSFHVGSTPDTAPYLLAAAAACGLKMELRGVGHLRIKESDRIISMQKALEPANVSLREASPGIIQMDAQQATLNKHLIINPMEDHRIAMAMAPLVIKTNKMTIHNPKVTGKSYPNFWDELKKCGINVYQHD